MEWRRAARCRACGLTREETAITCWLACWDGMGSRVRRVAERLRDARSPPETPAVRRWWRGRGAYASRRPARHREPIPLPECLCSALPEISLLMFSAPLPRRFRASQTGASPSWSRATPMFQSAAQIQGFPNASIRFVRDRRDKFQSAAQIQGFPNRFAVGAAQELRIVSICRADSGLPKPHLWDMPPIVRHVSICRADSGLPKPWMSALQGRNFSRFQSAAQIQGFPNAAGSLASPAACWFQSAAQIQGFPNQRAQRFQACRAVCFNLPRRFRASQTSSALWLHLAMKLFQSAAQIQGFPNLDSRQGGG